MTLTKQEALKRIAELESYIASNKSSKELLVPDSIRIIPK
jgi:hypothetical protein